MKVNGMYFPSIEMNNKMINKLKERLWAEL